MSLVVDTASGALAALRALNAQDAASSSKAQSQAQSQAQSSAQAQQASTSGSSGSSASVRVQVAADGYGLAAAANGLGQAAAVTDTAQAGAGAVVQLLQQLKQAASAGTDPSLSSADRQGLAGDFQALVAQVGQAVGGASANGINLIDGSASPGVQVTADADGGQATLSAYDLTPGGPLVSVSADASLDTASAASAALTQVSGSLEAASGTLANLSTQAKQIGAHSDFVARLGAALGAGSKGLDSADGVRLQALQLQQDLSAQPGAIANAGPSSLLALFKQD